MGLKSREKIEVKIMKAELCMAGANLRLEMDGKNIYEW